MLGDPDLVIVPGGGWNDRDGKGAYYEARRGVITQALRERHARGGRIGSVCTGAMLLAEAGILDRPPAITHHSAIEDLRSFGANVVEGARVVDDGDIITAAGVTSGIDMALHIVAQVEGRCGRRGAGRRDRVDSDEPGEHVRLIDGHERVGVVDLDEPRVRELGREAAAQFDREAAVLGRPGQNDLALERPQPRARRRA